MRGLADRGMALLSAAGGARADGDAARGEKKFEDCAACHTLERGENSVGPSLHGVFGRKAGELDGFPLFAGAQAQRHHLDAADARHVHRRSAEGRCPPTACPMPACRTRATAPT